MPRKIPDSGWPINMAPLDQRTMRVACTVVRIDVAPIFGGVVDMDHCVVRIDIAPIFSGVVDMDPILSPGGRRTYDLCGTCKRTMDNEVPGIMYSHNNEQTVTHRLYTGLYCNKM